MMVIPASLPASLVPLAWMLGAQKGWGMRPDFDETKDFVVIEEITGTIRGEQMLLTTSIYRGVPKTDVQIGPVWDAAAGLANIVCGDLIFGESMYVPVLPGSRVLLEPGEYVPREFIATSATTNALSVLWAGVDVGPRVQMVSDAIARGTGVQGIEHLERMYGLVIGELMWTQERILISNEAEVEISGRLICVVQTTIEPGEMVEEINTEAEDGLGG